MNYHIDRNAPLNKQDTEKQTFGCRALNPDICKYCMNPDFCGLSRQDHICKNPPRGWGKQFFKLKNNQNIIHLL